jgi:tetratricopeptide (TPR) repeat protein
LALEINLRYQLPEIYRGWALLHLSQNNPASALEAAQKALAQAREQQMVVEVGLSLRVLGQVLTAQGQHQPAIADFTESLTHLDGHNPYESARTRVAFGLALASKAQEHEQTQRLLTEAQAAFKKLGAQNDLTALEQILETSLYTENQGGVGRRLPHHSAPTLS